MLGLCYVAGFNLPGQTFSLSLTNDNGLLSLSWPAWATDAVVERSTNADPFSSWAPVPANLYQSDSAGLHYSFSAEEGSWFYRARRVGPVVPGLVGYWSLDEGSGSVAVDQAGSGGPLYMTNMAWAPGRFGAGSIRLNGEALDSGGSLAWVSNTNYQVLPPAGLPFSVSFWFSPDGLPSGWQRILGNDVDGSEGWNLGLNNSGPGTNYLVLSGSGNASSLSITGRTLIIPQQWHQLTLSYSSNQTSLYLDSMLLAQGTGTLFNPEAPLCLGGGETDQPGFLGRIDEFRIYTNALSQEEISVTGLWHFDENSGSLALDSSVRGHPGAVVVPTQWAPGKTNSGIDLSAGQVAIPNDDYSVLPPSGAPFSVSLWVLPRDLPSGRSGLLICADGTKRGWQLTVNVDDSTNTWIEFTSTNLGGTLALRALAALTNGIWTKLDLTYNGGLASVYLNGCKAGSELGAIQGAPAPLILGPAPGVTNFNGIVDELRIYNRERDAAEIGPVALAMWETALAGTNTDLILQGSGPPGKLLTYSVLSNPAPTLGTITYSPGSAVVSYLAGAQKGPDAFAYTVSDGEFVSPPATAVVSVVEPHWLAPNGGSLAPLDGSSPEQAWSAGDAGALDAIWNTNNYYDCFFYAPGEYQTTGWKYPERSTANPGCKHIGSGSDGPGATILKLVNNWSAWGEGVIFSGLHQDFYSDGFEVRNLVLDCNAENNPKYVVGEPVWLRVPLSTTAHVDDVTLYWSEGVVPATPYKVGPPAQFSLCTHDPGAGTYTTNFFSVDNASQVAVISVKADTDELLLYLTQRAEGVDLYGLAEMDVAGAIVSLPTATVPGGGESLLDNQHSVLQAFDGDPATSWASGPEETVQITLPLFAGTAISQINFRWNCETLTNLSRLGPSAGYLIYAHDENTGQMLEVPFTSHGRSSNGVEIATFGTVDSTNTVITDQLTILLMVREPGVDHYSLRELSLQQGFSSVPLRIPSAMNALATSPASIMKAFDGDTNTYWVSDTQGSLTAIDVRGSNLKFSGLKIIGFGTKAGRECFPLIVGGASAEHPISNVLIEDCLFTAPAHNNSDGVSAVAMAGPGRETLRNAIIRRCAVIGIGPYFAYSHGFGANLIENCLVDDCAIGAYYEPGGGLDSIGTVLIRSNVFRNVVFGITVDFHPGAHFDSLLCLDNEIVLSDTAVLGYGIRLCDVCTPGLGGVVTNLLALNNTVRYPQWGPGPTAGGLMYADIQHAVYGNNLIVLAAADALRVRPYPAGIIPDKPPPEDCDHPRLVLPGPSTVPPSLDTLPLGYRRAWYNNRDLSGGLLPVLYSEWGVDRPASQQQWPE